MNWNYVIAAIIGILIYQVITLIVFIITKENEYAVVITSMLVPFGLWMFVIAPIVSKLWLAWCRKYLNEYRICYRRSDGTIDDDLDRFYATDKAVASFTQDETQKYFIRKTKEGKDFTSAPFTSRIYKGQQHFRGRDMNTLKPQQV